MTTRLQTQTALAGCCGKTAFPTAAKAWTQLRLLTKNARKVRGLTVYRCPVCTQWHLGRSES